MKLRLLTFAACIAVASVCGPALAQSIGFVPVHAVALPGAGNPTHPALMTLNWDAAGSTADTIEFEVEFDASKVTLVATGVGSADCSAAPGLLTVIRFDGGASIPSGALCNLSFTTTSGAVDGDVVALTLRNPVLADAGEALPAPLLTSGSILVRSAPVGVPVLAAAYVPDPEAAGTIGSSIGVGTLDFEVLLAVPAQGSGSVVCGDADTVVPPILTTVPATQTGLADTVSDVLVSCALTDAIQTGAVSCSLNGGVPMQFAVTCPAGAIGSVGPLPPRPLFIPASSKWSLIGLIIAQGAALIALRRRA